MTHKRRNKVVYFNQLLSSCTPKIKFKFLVLLLSSSCCIFFLLLIPEKMKNILLSKIKKRIDIKMFYIITFGVPLRKKKFYQIFLCQPAFESQLQIALKTLFFNFVLLFSEKKKNNLKMAKMFFDQLLSV